jgi:hypothetical protein
MGKIERLLSSATIASAGRLVSHRWLHLSPNRPSFSLHSHCPCPHIRLTCSALPAFSFLFPEHAAQASVAIALFFILFYLGIFCRRCSCSLSRSRSPVPRLQEEVPSPVGPQQRYPVYCYTGRSLGQWDHHPRYVVVISSHLI